jgi:hypothetical protein
LIHLYIKYHALTVDVSIYTSIKFRTAIRVAIKAQEWLEWDEQELATRISGRRGWRAPRNSDDEARSSLVGSKDAPVGRLISTFNLSMDNRFGVVTTGGFRCTNVVTHFAGILLGNPSDATRNMAAPIMSLQDLGDWMERNETVLVKNSMDARYDLRLSSLMLRLRRRPRCLSVFAPAWSEARFLTHPWGDQVTIALNVPPTKYWSFPDVIFAPFGRMPFIELFPGRDWLEETLPPVDMTYGGPLAEHALLLLSEVWGTDIATVKAGVEIPQDRKRIGDAVGRDEEDEGLFSHVIIANRPGAPVPMRREQPDPIEPSILSWNSYDPNWVSPNTVQCPVPGRAEDSPQS